MSLLKAIDEWKKENAESINDIFLSIPEFKELIDIINSSIEESEKKKGSNYGKQSS